MPRRHYPPAYLRYLKARLWNLEQPSFWGTAIFLSVVGLVTWEYWSNPDIFTRQQNKQVTSQKPVNSSLSAEERAIAADIDNLPVLFNDFEQATFFGKPNTPKENTQGKQSKGLLEDVMSKRKAAANDAKSNSGLGTVNSAPPPNLKNPFVVQAENLLQGGTVDNSSPLLNVNSLTGASEQIGGVQTSSSLGIGLTNQSQKNQNSLPVSPLEAALKQSTNQQPSFNSTTSTQTNALGQTLVGGASLTPPTNSLPSQTLIPSTGTSYTQTGTNLPQNPYGNLNGNQAFPNIVPTTPVTTPVTSAVPTNITPYSSQIPTQVAPNNIAPYSSQIPSQNVVTPTSPAGYGNYGLQPQPTQRSQPNFSDSRMRQYLNGGQK